MFRVKICGITNPDDALHAVAQGADALGLNFYSPSPRCISLYQADKIVEQVRQLDKLPKLVGVFVNEPVDRLRIVGNAAKLDAWQLHGDEPPSLLAELLRSKIIRQTLRAFRCRDQDLTAVQQYLSECVRLHADPQGVLLDAYAPDAFGGTGKVIDWNAVREQRDKFLGVPVILAGGLTPDNIAQAIRTARPDGVDVASGVESSPGKKDPVKVRDFVAAARGAFEELMSSKPGSV